MTEYYDPETYPKEWNYLQSGTIIDQYMIERELAHGGFSSVYLGRQLHDQFQVAIKEYLPRKLAHRTWNNIVVANNEDSQALFRHGRALFFEEAKVLATLKHPNIVEVINFFGANSTAYMVMTYDYGITLDKVLSKKLLPVTEAFMLTLFGSLLAGVGHIHDHHYLHLDIKPANILVRPGNDALLLDFGAIQSYPNPKLSRQGKVLTKGFSPVEQHIMNSHLNPATDIYAIGASMRACLECKSPIPSTQRFKHDTLTPAVKAFKRKYPEALLKAVDWAMQLQPENRPQSVAELQQALLNG
ncbi:MAG: serine/threonine protein kinase [Methylobacter sp.]|nr:MAG: serine/threonine protein kinase [Methylobacter sp.]PPD21275.1 MAG: serine/threonine protein kinase [Methylobacter sp.]